MIKQRKEKGFTSNRIKLEKRPVYHGQSYQFGKVELIVEVLRAMIQNVITGILFFRSWKGCVLLFPLVFWDIRKRKGKKQLKRQMELRMDFREVILSIAASLHAGFSLEQTIPIALEDLKRLYPGEKRLMMEELTWMLRSRELNMSIEQLFAELAYRSGLEEIQSFATILETVKRQGGNLVRISRESAEHISQKIQVQMEIEQVIAGKKFEKNIMILMPYFILVYLQLTNGDYLNPLFHNLYGNVCMLICLAIIQLAEWWADKVVEIPV